MLISGDETGTGGILADKSGCDEGDCRRVRV